MSFSIHPVEVKDVEVLIRKVEYPAHQNGPLRLFMFPGSDEDSKGKEEEIQWMIEGLFDTLRGEAENLLKACGLDGSPVGFIGWVYEKRQIEGISIKKKGLSERKGDNQVPSTLDVASWIHVSKRLRQERQRVLQTCKGNKICRITSMAVSPNYQRQLVGSMLLKSVCDEADRIDSDAFVMSSPAGVRLYSKYGFKRIGVVNTSKGVFTSMLRTANMDEGHE